MNHWLVRGRVMHSRTRPAANRFVYPVFYLRFPLERRGELTGPLFSLDRFNLFSFHARDHGPRDGSDLLAWARGVLNQYGLAEAGASIELQTFPRVLGFVFNPISFWYCRDAAGRLRAVLCEVNNTFGGTHTYLVAHADGRPIEPGDRLVASKRLHVSPFCRVEGHYRFTFEPEQVRIDYHDRRGLVLATTVGGVPTPLTTASLVRIFVAYPWMTLAVWLRIHWQAFVLWTKGVPFLGKAPASSEHPDHEHG